MAPRTTLGPRTTGLALCAAGLLAALACLAVFRVDTRAIRTDAPGLQPDSLDAPTRAAPALIDPELAQSASSARRPPPAPPAPAPRPDTLVRGRVIDETGAPVASASVEVGALPPHARLDRGRVSIPWIASAAGASGEDGRFEIGLRWPAGSLALIAEHPGHLPTRRSGLASAPRAELDVGDVLLARGVALRGRVEDAHGAPVPGAEILLTELDAGGGAQSCGESALDGSFTLVAPEGLVRLAASSHLGESAWCDPLRVARGSKEAEIVLRLEPGHCAPGFVLEQGTDAPIEALVHFEPFSDVIGAGVAVATRPDGSFEACGLRIGAGYRISVEAAGHADVSGLQIVFVENDQAPGPFDLRMSPVTSLRLRVVDSRTRAPLSGASVFFAVSASGRGPATNGLAIRDAFPVGVTDASGEIVLPERPEWSAGARVSHPGYAAALVRPSRWVATDSGPATLRLERACELEVSVEGAGPGAEVEVDLYRCSRSPDIFPFLAHEPLLRSLAAKSLPARFSGLAPDGYIAVARAPDRAPAWTERISLGESEGERLRVSLSLTEGATLRGIVTGRTLRSGARVRALGPAGLEVWAAVDAPSTYRLAGLPAGEWCVWVEEPPFAEDVVVRRYEIPAEVVVLSLAGRETRDLDLSAPPEAFALAGTLLVNGLPRAGARVSALPAEPRSQDVFPRRTLTDREGGYRLSDLRADELEVTAGEALPGAVHQHAGPNVIPWLRVRVERSALGAAPGARRLDLVVETAHLSLAAFDAAGAPVPWCMVELAPDPPRGGVPGIPPGHRWELGLGEDSRRTLELPLGAYTCRLSGPDGMLSPPAKLRLERGGHLERALTLRPP